MVTSSFVGAGAAPTKTTLPVIAPATLCPEKPRNPSSSSALENLENRAPSNRPPFSLSYYSKNETLQGANSQSELAFGVGQTRCYPQTKIVGGGRSENKGRGGGG